MVERLLGLSDDPRCTVVKAKTRDTGIAGIRGGEDIILLDLSLPESTGVDTFRRMNAAAPSVPIVRNRSNITRAMGQTCRKRLIKKAPISFPP